MKKLRKLGVFSALAIGLTGTLVLSEPAEAAAGEIDTTVVNEKWGKPTFVYGGGLSTGEVDKTKALLNIKNPENVASVSINGQDVIDYLGSGSGNTSSLISSVLVEKENKGNGVEVTIETPENITQITQEQYANAAITAGVSDATILVASIRPATGESALTGVYKAFDVNGDDLDQDRMEVAQEELETTNEIAQENAEKSKFDSGKLDQAMIDIKQSLSDLKDQQGKLATKEDIQQIINDAIEKNNLENVVTQDQMDKLMALFENYQKTSAIDSEEVKNQLKNLSGTVKDKLGDLVGQAEESGLLDKIGSFFRQLWHTVTSFFN